MAFQAELSKALAAKNVTLNPQDCPTQEEAGVGASKLSAFFSSMDEETAQIVDTACSEFPIKGLLASPEVGVAPELGKLFAAADKSPTGLSLSTLLSLTIGVLQAPGEVPAPDPPVITDIHARQVTLKEPGCVFVTWTSSRVDKYVWFVKNVHKVPGSINDFNGQEIDVNNATRFTAKLINTMPMEQYTTTVQACLTPTIGSDNCSSNSQERSITIPENTRSLRDFLLISGVALPITLRRLDGTPFAGGVRRMMHL